MAIVGLSDEELAFQYGSPSQPFSYLPDQVWPMTMQNPPATASHGLDMRRETQQLHSTQSPVYPPSSIDERQLMSNWPYSQPPSHYSYPAVSQPTLPFSGLYPPLPLQNSPVGVVMSGPQVPLATDMALENTYMAPSQSLDTMPLQWQDVQSGLPTLPPPADAALSMAGQSTYSASPTETHLEVRSLTSVSDSDGWVAIDPRRSLERGGCIDPIDTLHNRTSSESSWSSEPDQHYRNSNLESFEVVSNPLHSPSSDSNPDLDRRISPGRQRLAMETSSCQQASAPSQVSPVAVVRPVPVPLGKPGSDSSSPLPSPISRVSTSPESRRAAKKSPIAKSTDKVTKRPLPVSKVDNEKRVGKRKGPLRPEQRKQASEIRKLRACLRCKFLKKTCDKGEPCAGCQPSHARLWQVPCTRIDIKEIGFFTKDYRADYARHLNLELTVGNIKGFADSYRTLFISHGYGQMLPLTVREVYVRDEKMFDTDWSETTNHSTDSKTFVSRTGPLYADQDCLSTAMMSDYLDRHLDVPGSFHNFVDSYCGDTPFLTQMLKTAFNFYSSTKAAVIRKALKFLLAYSLTLHITIVEGIPKEEEFPGRVDDESSQYFGKIVAPSAINFQVKTSMGNLWRDLQKEVLEELSALYSSVYSGDKLKQWPTIFILASLLLAVWEFMQFDAHRVSNSALVDSFLHDMETVPVGVVVGLFQAISQKLPSFLEWDTSKHHHVLQSNEAACKTMTEVRDNVTRHEHYLRSRATTAKYDAEDFDSLSNKLLSKLVIRAN